ncbi:hypothetical protein RQP46_002020 [Phenoliferia psychrophenolica]
MSSPTLESLKSRYRTAAKAFVLTDYSSAALALEPVGGGGGTLASPSWLSAVEHESPSPLLDLERKLAVLRITFLATVHNSTTSPSVIPSTCLSLSALASLPARALINALWADLTSSPLSASSDIFATPSAAFLHPSLVLALALSALKLDEPRSARAVIEAWFGSVSEQVDRVIFDEVSQDTFEWRDFAIEGEGASMAASSSVGDVDPKKSLVRSWVRLYDLLSLHVLPRLGEWEAAADFARAQSVENGGWVPDERVEASLRQITQVQQDEALAISSKLQRQRDLDLESLKLDTNKHQRDAHRRRDPKGKSRAPNDEDDLPKTNGHRSDGSSPSSSPRGGKSSSKLVTATPPVRSLAAYIRHHYATDPVRLLTVVCFVFAFSSWVHLFGDQAAEDAVREQVDAASAAGLAPKITWLSAEQALAEYGAVTFSAARIPGNNLFPLKFVANVFTRAQRQCEGKGVGLELYTSTMVNSVVPTKSSSTGAAPRWTVKTSRGDVSATHVIHATNAYASHLLPHLSSGPHCIVPTRGQVLSLVPSPLSNPHWTTAFSSDHSSEMYYFQRPNGGPVILGGARAFARPKFEFGTVDDGSVGQVFVEGKPLPGQFVSAGYSGHGMTRAPACAEIIASMVLGDITGDTFVLPDWFPTNYVSTAEASSEMGMGPEAKAHVETAREGSSWRCVVS